MKAVILAGGKGTRLRPYTTAFPKPLMPIGEKPILEIIVRQLAAHNLTDIVMTVGHLGELIAAFFGDGSAFGVNVTYAREDTPLGTAGGLGLIRDDLNDTFLIVNGDTLTTLDYTDLINFHKGEGAAATVALKRRQIHIDFGVVEVNGDGTVRDYIEKPTHESLVSMGISVLQPDVLEHIEQGQYLDFPTLIQRLVARGKRVSGYIYDGYWLDIGRPEDYERANAEIEEIYGRLGIG